MNTESSRTVTFAVTAAISLAVAFFFAPSRPKPPSDFVEVGKAFYDDFEAVAAKSLSVVSYNADSTKSKVFSVEQKNGQWVISSHRDYPADGKDRLAKTAASIIGIKREQFWTRDPEQYEALQVVDPEDPDTKKIKGRGQRITLKDGAGKVLADYIIGKQVAKRDGYYYLRRPDEKAVYIAKLEIDLSTKFSDWIEADLLQLAGENVQEIIVNKYSVDERKGRLVGREISELTREKSADPWKLKGLDDTKEEVDQEAVNNMSRALDDLQIVGVRAKPEGLSADLKSEAGIKLDIVAIEDLHSKGYFLGQDGELISNEGEIVVVTDAGADYVMRFGEVFSGDELEVETGIEADKKAREKKADDPKTEAKKDDEKKSGQNRYMFITVHFDEKAIGKKPTKPTPPEPAKVDGEQKPAEDPAAATKKEGDGDKKAEESKTEAPKTEDKAKVDEKAKADYEAALKKYETDLKTYNDKIEAGKKKVKELNDRFADWYYVISNENFQKLRLSRSSLVKAKPAPMPTETKPEAGAPEEKKPTEAKPEEKAATDNPPESSEKPAEPKTEDKKPEGDMPKADQPEPPAKPDEKPEAETPAEKKE